MQTSSFNLLFTAINQGLAKRKVMVVAPFSKQVVNVLMCLKRNNLIYGYTISRQRKVIFIFLIFSHNMPIFEHLFIYSSKKRVLEISLIELKKFQNRTQTTLSPILLIRSTRGYLTHLEALKLGVSGRVAGRILL